MGHSQGGGAAWAAAERQSIELVPGYLGAIAVSPVTSVLEEPDPAGSFLRTTMSPGVASFFSAFKTSEILQPEGQQALDILLQVQGCSAFATGLLTPPILAGSLVTQNWTQNTFLQQYQALTTNGGKEISGPMLVIHGKSDPLLSVDLTITAVNATVSLYPASEIDYHLLPNTSHVPALTGSQ